MFHLAAFSFYCIQMYLSLPKTEREQFKSVSLAGKQSEISCQHTYLHLEPAKKVNDALFIDGHSLVLEDIEAVARDRRLVELSDLARKQLWDSRAVIDRFLQSKRSSMASRPDLANLKMSTSILRILLSYSATYS